MKKIILIFSLFIIAYSCSSVASNQKVMEAALLGAKALTISNEEVSTMTLAFIQDYDKQNKLSPAGSKYSQRLEALTSRFVNEDGMNLNFKVYETPEINAFATADGSIRVYSGLMDVMTDDELVAIIGHEIGHVRNNDSRDAMKTAYGTAAALAAVGATGKTASSLVESDLGGLANAFIGAQYSQKQELAADDYGFAFTIKYGYDKYAMARSLEKLDSIANQGGEGAGLVQKMFSSHPESKKRAQRMREKADKYKPQENQMQKQLQNQWTF